MRNKTITQTGSVHSKPQKKNFIVMSRKDGINIIHLLLISLVAAMGGLMFGFDIAIISGAVPFIEEYFNLNELELGWGVSSLLLGCIFGAMFAGKLSDLYGRKRMLIIVALFFAVSCLVTALSTDFIVFVTARLVGGLAVGAASMLSPMYIAEISPSKVRGTMVALNQLTIVSGILISYLINYLLHDIGENNWRWMFASGTIPSVLFFVFLFFVPESPRWLYKFKQEKKAFNILEKIGGHENATREIAQIKKNLKQSKANLKELLKPGIKKVVGIGIMLAILIQFSGINTIIDYAPIIFESTGSSIDAALFQTFIIGIINFTFTFIAIAIIDKVGRKPLYLVGSAGMTITLLLLTTLFITGHFKGIIVLILILLFIAFFASCIGPVFWVYMSELFPNRVRGTAMSVAVLVNWLCNFLVVLLFPWMLREVGGAFTFGFLALMGLVMLIFTWRYVPETKGKTLEEIEEFWK